MKTPPKIVGILNITSDSFSDGGLYLDPEKAFHKSEELYFQGADLIDIGAESSNPDGNKVGVEEELGRLIPVIKALKTKKIPVSVDTYKPEVMEAVLKEGADMINDITALRDKNAVSIVKQYKVPIVIMHAKNTDPRAERVFHNPKSIMENILNFFGERIEALENNGIGKERLIIDPGMGLFIGSNPEPSLKVLKEFHRLKSLGVPTYVSTSRKSFIGNVIKKSVPERGPGTLATEIWAVLQGADYIRTHDVAALKDALAMFQAIGNLK